MARDSAELRGRAKVRPFRVGQLVDLADPAAVRAAIANLSLAWGGLYTPILDANQPFDAIEFQARVFDLDCLYLEHGQDSNGRSNELFDELRSSGWHWRGHGQHGPFAADAEEGFRTGVLPTSAVALEQPTLYIPTWDDTDPLAGFYAALFGTSPNGDGDPWVPPGSQQVGIGALLAVPGLTVDDAGLIQTSRVGLSAEPHYDSDWMNGLFVVRPDEPQDLVAFWNMRSFGRPVVAVPAVGAEELLPFLTRGSVPGGTSVYGGPERRTERFLGVWQLPNASPATRAAIDAMAARLGMVVREHRLNTSHYRFPGVDSRFKASVRAEFPPSAGHVMVRVPSVPVAPEAHHVMPGMVAVEVDVHNVTGLDPRSVASLPPLRRFGRLLERMALGHAHEVRINAAGDGVVLGVAARNDEVPVGFVYHLDGISTLLDDESVKVAQSEDGRFQTRAAQMLGGPAGNFLTQPGVRTLIEKAGRSATGLPLQQLKSEVLNNRGAWPDKLTAFRTSPAEYAEGIVNQLLYSGLFVPMLDAHCSHCRVDMQVSPRDLDATIQCEFCGETFRLALSLALSKSRWRFRLASHLGPEKVKALLPALATSSLLNQFSVRSGAAGPHAFGVEFRFPGNRRMEADIVTWLSYPDYAVAVAEVKNGNWIDGNDVQNLEDLQTRFDRAKVRSVLVFSSLKAALATEERDVLRALVERASWTSTALGAQVPRVPLVLTSRDLSIPWDDDNHPHRWESPGGTGGVFATAVESCKRNLGLVDIIPADGGSASEFVCTWEDEPPSSEAD